MQRTESDGIVIACDFCATDWDQARPMIEGHRGSVLCLECLKRALHESATCQEPFTCTLCLQPHDVGHKAWRHTTAARACWACVRLAAKTFHADPDVDFRWDPSRHPPA